MKKNKQHPAACPCEECRKVVEQANEALPNKDNADPSRLKKLSPEAARVLGYIPTVDSDES